MKINLHKAAENGTLKDLPPEALTREAFLREDADGRTPLYVAALNGHLDQVPEAIKSDRALWLVRSRNGTNPLHVAAFKGHLAQVPDTIKGDRDLWLVKNNFGRTPLHLAAHWGHLNQVPESIRQLINASAQDEKREDLQAT